MITQERLKEKFEYDPTTGVFTRKASQRRSSERVGNLEANGYLRINIDGKKYLAHRLAWLFVYGVLPNELDHVDGQRAHNAIANLREVSRTENCFNRTKREGTTSSRKGVSRCQGKWQAEIKVGDKRIYLGRFEDEDAAAFAYEEAAERYFGEFAKW